MRSIVEELACGAHAAPDRLHIWSHCRGAYGFRADTALALGMPPENIEAV
jgi:hypothetical protein